MNRIHGAAIPQIEQAMRFRLVRQGALASNVANADTPSYRRVDVSFDQTLERASNAMKSTDPRHFGHEEADRYRFSRGPLGARPDRNGVDRDQEILGLTRNAGAFKNAANVLSRIYAMRRMAATGELS